jgi:hypothetical protein
VDIDLTAHHYIDPKNEPSNLKIPTHGSSCTHVCNPLHYRSIQNRARQPLSLFALTICSSYVKKSRPTSANSSPVQIVLRLCPIRAISWFVRTLAWLISPMSQCLGDTNLLPIKICLPFLNLQNAEKCFCTQAGGHFFLTCRATMTASPCNSPLVSMGRHHM